MQRDRPLRQIGTLPKDRDPKVFTDYLLSLGMRTRVDEQPEGWGLWIYNEDHVARARDEFQSFLSQPDDPRFREAAPVAQTIRRQEQQLDRQFRKNYREVADLWAYPTVSRRPLTSALIAMSIVVFVLQQSSVRPWLQDRMWFTTFYRDLEGHIHDNGLSPILHGEVWRLVTPVVMHVNILHIFFNMWWLSALGTLIEVRRGTLRLAGLVLISAILSNLGQYLYDVRTSDQAHPAEGMSGVVYGLFGYIWMKMVYEPEQQLMIHPNNITIMIFWLFLCMTGVVGPIANAAHVVGLVVGVTLGLFRY
jgi:GlpG protein